MNITLHVGQVFQGIMAYWNKIEESVSYTLTLYASDNNNECEIATILLDRNTRYYTFQGLSSKYSYSLKVEAEGRDGKIIAQSDREKCYPGDVVNIAAKGGIRVYQY